MVSLKGPKMVTRPPEDQSALWQSRQASSKRGHLKAGDKPVRVQRYSSDSKAKLYVIIPKNEVHPS